VKLGWPDQRQRRGHLHHVDILFQSLRLAPIQAAFEHLVLSFADVAYQYQANTAEYCDKSHAPTTAAPGRLLPPRCIPWAAHAQPALRIAASERARRSAA